MRRLFTITALGLGLALASVAPDPATAGVRARVELEKRIGPAQVRVRLHTPDRVVRHRGPAPIRVQRADPWFRLSRRDRAVAHRLSVVAGIAERPLVVKRARGLTWTRIARMHRITHRELFVAQHPRRFAQWLGHRPPSNGPCHDSDRGRGHGRGHRGGHRRH